MLTDKQQKHLAEIRNKFHSKVGEKYRQGAEEHEGFLGDKPIYKLIDEAINEAVDQFVYLQTLRDNIFSNSFVSGAGSVNRLAEDVKAWSEATFGTRDGRGCVGPLKHIKLECDEAINSKQIDEFADILILLMDATWRNGWTFQYVIDEGFKKMEINRSRKHPKPVGDEPCEHIRDEKHDVAGMGFDPAPPEEIKPVKLTPSDLKMLTDYAFGPEVKRPTIVCLCGSTRFAKAFADANLDETLAGKIVLSVGSYSHSDEELLKSGRITEEVKKRLDVLHLHKIDLADEILVINPLGFVCVDCGKPCGASGSSPWSACCQAHTVWTSYIGSSTRNEILYAAAKGKRISSLSPLPSLEMLRRKRDQERKEPASSEAGSGEDVLEGDAD